MTLSIRKVRKTKTVNMPPYGRVPIKDSKEDHAPIVIGEKHIKRGSINRPDACAIALALRDNADKVSDGLLLGAWVYKTYTLLAIQKGGRIQARRFVHDERTRKGINGFDTRSQNSLRVGDVVVLQAPTGHKRLGACNGTSSPGGYKPKNPRPKQQCARKRGVFVDHFHAKQADREQGKDASVIQ